MKRWERFRQASDGDTFTKLSDTTTYRCDSAAGSKREEVYNVIKIKGVPAQREIAFLIPQRDCSYWEGHRGGRYQLVIPHQQTLGCMLSGGALGTHTTD